ncbi:hypothetical protein PF010_g12404 [Phytophthora fragariae]|uniref:Uncharacterized protein n=2 Tax=Phytophthora fragariae TaxID=53985 RepID=A0A6A3YXS4_9STRA|nr:hypothetical protein PF009_g13997 [Phytophthora fragariae]KAE9006079.1 hypothetical protein PF011_g11761 [Phytophthora fragariae]KAE9107075.1 hypothetical protein PF010_g12404 [Phytophthora fragariae]KAE9107402.1 hypothetical protein PF007_g13058 [Phytophthora fragariae]KAE9225987.1 hypothetical protein PF002_g14244 [Phytophthora fragariae]
MDPNVIPTSGAANEAPNTLLYHAITKQDIALATLLLDHGADPNGLKSEDSPNYIYRSRACPYISQQGYSPLRAAMVRNNVALIKLLLDRGADVNHYYKVATGNHEVTKTVLFETAMNTTYELMLKSGADVHASDSWDNTPLHFQSYNWNSRLVRALVSGGADVNAVNMKKCSPLDSAIFRKPSQRRSDDDEFMEVCRILLKNKVVVTWSNPEEYFRSKVKPGVDGNAVKARVQLVFEWEAQRQAGDMSFKLPIEVFHRGALDIATYFSALNRGQSLSRKSEAALLTVEAGDAGELANLLFDGADPNATFPSGSFGQKVSLLYTAVDKGAVNMVTLLLDNGATADGSDDIEVLPPLLAAVKRDNLELVQLLRSRGANVNKSFTLTLAADSEVTRTILFELPSAEVFNFLLEERANVHVKDSCERTPLHEHAANWKEDTARLLIESGADVNALDENNDTPLDAAISSLWIWSEDFIRVCHLLLANHAEVPWGDPNEYFSSRNKPEYFSASMMPRIQLAHEWAQQRDSGAKDLTPMPVEIFEEGPQAISDFFKKMNQSLGITPLQNKTKRDVGRQHKLASRATKGGARQVARSGSFVRTPEGHQWSQHSKGIELQNTLYRSKVCVVGPSQWGKTSFIKSFTTGSSTLEDKDVRTIGIDQFPWSFEVQTDTGDCEYQVSFWDFAGQEEYRASHTLFYSSRTLYLLCVNIDLYSKTLRAAAMDSADQPLDNNVMDTFVELHLFKWVRMICAHHPQAEFAFLGTKADLVQYDPKKIRDIQQDVVSRFKLNIRRMKDRVERALMDAQNDRLEIQERDATAETKELDEKIAGCEEILRKQPVLLSQEFIIFSSADMKYKTTAIGKMKALMLMSGRAVELPPSYAELLKYTQQKRVSGQQNHMQIQEQVDTAFLPVKAFVDSVVQSSQLSIPKDEVLGALHLLHDTGDILWFDGVSDAQLLQERLFLDPMLVIDFIRQIINHKIAPNAALDGAVRHSVLQSLPYWKDVSTSTTHQLKLLLLHLHLAYPAGKATKISWNSDLVVPVYWKLAPGTSESKDFPTEEDKAAGLTERVRWEYSFEPAIPENLFEKLAVVTYSPSLLFERSYTRSSFIDRVADKCSALVDKDAGSEGAPCTLSITVVARERTLAWKHLVWYCMNLENLLRTYPGLLVTRSTVNPRGRYYDVDQLLSDQDHVKQLIAGTNQEILPFDMQWYTNKSCELQPVTFTDIEAADLATQPKISTSASTTQGDISDRSIERICEQFKANADLVMRGQIALITGMNNKAKFPSLWTLEYQGFEEEDQGFIAAATKKVTTTVVVKFRSDLTGKCHHDGIPISVAKEVFAGRFGECLKVGLTLLSAAVPDFLGINVVDVITDECKEQLDRSMEFHGALKRSGVAENLAAGPQHMDENRALSPSEILDLLRRLLEIHNKNFQTEDIPQLSGLTCGIMVNPTRYIWASRDEIREYGDRIVLANDYASKVDTAALERTKLPAQMKTDNQQRFEIPVQAKTDNAGRNEIPKTNDAESSEARAASVVTASEHTEVPISVEKANAENPDVVTPVEGPSPAKALPSMVPVSPERGSAINSSKKYELQEGKKGVLSAMRRRLSSAKPSTVSVLERYSLKIIGAKGLTSKSKNPFCICRFDATGNKPQHEVQTNPHRDGGQNPSWSSQSFEVALPLDATEHLTIVFTVKQANGMRSTRLAQGNTVFVAPKPGQKSTHDVGLTKNDNPAGTLQFSLEAIS